MTPIQDMLHRIQWDPEFGKARFVIGYYDRVADRIIRVPFQSVHLTRGERFSFDVVDHDGTARMIPLHRVREVWRDDKLIWKRKGE